MVSDESDDWDEPEDVPADDLGVDFDEDLLTIRDGTDGEDESEEADEADEDSVSSGEWADLDAALVEFVDLFNARDLDGLAELLAEDAEGSLLGEPTGPGIIDGLEELILRYPSMIVTRGDRGTTPLAAAWLFDAESEVYRLIGLFTAEVDGGDPPRITLLEYLDDIPDSEDLVVEVPDGTEIPEWEDWSAYDES